MTSAIMPAAAPLSDQTRYDDPREILAGGAGSR